VSLELVQPVLTLRSGSTGLALLRVVQQLWKTSTRNDAQIPGVWLPGEVKFCKLAPYVFNIVTAGFSFPTHKNVYQFTPTKLKEPDIVNFTGHYRLVGSSFWNLLHYALLETGILRWLPDFWKIYGPSPRVVLLPPSVQHLPSVLYAQHFQSKVCSFRGTSNISH